MELGSVVEEPHPIAIANTISAADERAKTLRLSREESAFYDALADNRSAVEKLGDESLAKMARELTVLVRKNATLDWNHKESVKAHLRRLVKRLLREYGYPPDAEVQATLTVLEQARTLGINMVEGGSEATGDLGDWANPPEAPTTTTAAPAPPPPKPLPYPIAVYDSLVSSQETAMTRIKMRFGGIETAFAFLSVALLSWLREEGNGALPEKANEMLAGIKPEQNVSMGLWIDLGCKLAGLVPEASTDPIARAARSLVAAKGNKPSEIATLAREAVKKRNDIIHENVTEATCAAAEAEVHTLGRRIEAAFAPLADCEMVALVALVKADFKAGTSRCRARILQGAKPLFDIQEREVKGSLDEGWCYLLRDGKAPLSLAPSFLCQAAENGGHDVFLVRSLGAKAGSKVEIAGMLGGGKKKIPLPG